MSLSKDSKIEDLRIDQKELLIQANLVAASSEAPSLVSINNSTLTATVISVDIKEPVKSCQKVQIINRATGQNAANPLSAAPVITHKLEDGSSKVSTLYVAADGKIVSSSISVTLNATGLSDVCICVDFKN